MEVRAVYLECQKKELGVLVRTNHIRIKVHGMGTHVQESHLGQVQGLLSVCEEALHIDDSGTG